MSVVDEYACVNNAKLGIIDYPLLYNKVLLYPIFVPNRGRALCQIADEPSASLVVRRKGTKKYVDKQTLFFVRTDWVFECFSEVMNDIFVYMVFIINFAVSLERGKRLAGLAR